MYRQTYKKNKYNAKSSVYNGRSYHSRAEGAYAAELDLRILGKDIKSWKPQVEIELNIAWFNTNNNHPILTATPGLELKSSGVEFNHICNYFIDFVVLHNDGSEEYVEVKGMETDLWKMKWKLCEAIFKDHPTINLTVVKV